MKVKLFQVISILAVLLMAVPATLVAAASPPQPTYVDEGASPPIYAPTVDGNTSDWNLTRDFFANLYTAWGNGGHTSDSDIQSKLYLIYDCATQTLYALVLTQPGVVLDTSDLAKQFIKLGTNNKLVDANDAGNTSLPEFAWVESGADKVGWEAAVFLSQGDYLPANNNGLSVHAQVLVDGATATSGVLDQQIELKLVCSTPSAVELASFTAQAGRRGVILKWETATEVNNLGFNLYRAESADGPKVRINDNLIVSQVPGSPVGASYKFVDRAVVPGKTYYYWLEDLDAYGSATLHGPVSASVQLIGQAQPAGIRPLPAPAPAAPPAPSLPPAPFGPVRPHR